MEYIQLLLWWYGLFLYTIYTLQKMNRALYGMLSTFTSIDLKIKHPLVLQLSFENHFYDKVHGFIYCLSFVLQNQGEILQKSMILLVPYGNSCCTQQMLYAFMYKLPTISYQGMQRLQTLWM